MKRRLLITGVTGLIGSTVLTKLLDLNTDFDITSLVRPNTSKSRYQSFEGKIAIEWLDLADTAGIRKLLENTVYQTILHIGALRGGRKADRKEFYAANVASTEQFINHALQHHSRFVFCSSVGVFGAIPDELPANNETPYREDNYYHYTKILCEKAINKAILQGLDAVIVRPSITYGTGDHGFPFTLTKLVDKHIFPVVNKNVWIHLCHIDTIAAAFVNLVTQHWDVSGRAFNIADLEPVQLRDLVNFISRQLHKKNYPSYLTVDSSFLKVCEYLARLYGSELWISRVELITHSWFYQVSDSYVYLDLPVHYTIPGFKLVVEDYQNTK